MKTKITILLLLLILAFPIPPIITNAEKGTITTSFPYLSDITRKIAGDDWIVTSIVPAGVDPHDYSLSINDVERLRESTIIIITNHTYFEQRIIELVKNGDIKPQKLIVTEEIKVLKILTNPDTRKPNLHMIYYDPDNLSLLAREIKEALVSVDPQGISKYEERYNILVNELNSVKENYTGKVKLRAVGSSPIVQYAVSWLGVEIVTFLLPEHEAQLSPQKQLEIQRMAENKEIEAVVIRAMYNVSEWKAATQHDQILIDIARRNGLTVIVVPDPLLYNPDLLQCLKDLTSNLHESNVKLEEPDRLGVAKVAGIITIIIIAIAIMMVIKKK